MMIRQLYKDSLIYGLSSILSQGIPILIVPIYTRFLSPDNYGGMDMLVVFAALVNLTVALEISQGVARSYADAQNEIQKSTYASTALWFSIAAYFLFAVLSLLFSGPLTRLLLDGSEWEPVFRVAVVAMTANGIFLFLQNQLRWLLKPKAYAASSIVYVIVTTGVAILLITGFQSGVIGVFYGQLWGAVIAGCIAWFPARKVYRLIFSRPNCLEMLAFSMPLVPSSISVLVSNYIDRIAIKHFMTLSDVGIYGVGFRFASVVNLLMVGFYSALTPLIYRHYRKDSTPGDIERIMRYFLLGTLPLIIAISLFSGEIVTVFATQEYYAAWTVIPALAMASILSRMYIFAPGLDISKKTKRIALINISAAAVNTALNLLFIPWLGIVGAALATLAGSCVMFLWYMAESQKQYPVPHRWSGILSASVVCMAFSFAVYLFEPSGQQGRAELGYKMLLLLCGTACILWLLRADKNKR